MPADRPPPFVAKLLATLRGATPAELAELDAWLPTAEARADAAKDALRAALRAFVAAETVRACGPPVPPVVVGPPEPVLPAYPEGVWSEHDRETRLRIARVIARLGRPATVADLRAEIGRLSDNRCYGLVARCHWFYRAAGGRGRFKGPSQFDLTEAGRLAVGRAAAVS